jgi:hypothetical protein
MGCSDRFGKYLFSGETPEFREKALHPLADGIGRDGVQLGNVVAGISIQFDLNQEIQFGIAEVASQDALLQEMAQQCMPFHGVVVDQLLDVSDFLFRPPVDRSFSACPCKELALHCAGNSEREVRLACLHLF